MICNICRKEIITVRDFYITGKCRSCHNKYMREYRYNNMDRIRKYKRDYEECRRWINGLSDRRDDLGPDIFVTGHTVNNNLRLYKKGKRIV